MKITEADLEDLAQLACLDIDTEKNQTLVDEINAIMDFVEQLRNHDTARTAPIFHPFDLHQRLRNDTITEEDCSAELAAIAPLFEDNLYLVPKVIDSGL